MIAFKNVSYLATDVRDDIFRPTAPGSAAGTVKQ